MLFFGKKGTSLLELVDSDPFRWRQGVCYYLLLRPTTTTTTTTTTDYYYHLLLLLLLLLPPTTTTTTTTTTTITTTTTMNANLTKLMDKLKREWFRHKCFNIANHIANI